MKREPVVRWLASSAVLLGIGLGIGAYSPLRAQADPDDVKRAVARVSVISGDVSVRRGDSGDWVAAVVNAPLMAGDYISTAPEARAEVQFDGANALRMSGDTQVRLAELEYNRYQLELARGVATYRVLSDMNIDVEVDTPNISVRPSKAGAYRISVGEEGQTELAVRSGQVEVFTPKGTQWVRAGQTMIARGSASDPEFRIAGATPVDEFDRWSEARDRSELQSTSARYVPQGVYGASDLDSYGNWVNEPDYGYCWTPAVDASWSPYTYGRWVWSDWYGWTWVSYDPWGWAPYHYGRWFYRDRWMWYPGMVGTRHYWSPALVAFVGWGSGGVGISFGNVGWVPLAPYETFHPWWGRSYYGRPGFINRNINITNVNITNIYVNSRVRNAVIGVRAEDFERGRFGSPGRYSGDQLRQVGIVRGGIPIAPQHANLQFSDRSVANVPRVNENVRFFNHRQPAAPQRISFDQQRRAFEQAGIGGRSGEPSLPAREGVNGVGRPNTTDPARGGRETLTGRPDSEARGQGGAPSAPDAGQRPSSKGVVTREGVNGVTRPNSIDPARGGRETFTGRNPADSAPPATSEPQRGAGAPTEGWNKFGDRSGRAGTNPAPAESRPAPNGNAWNRFGTPQAPGRQVNPRAEAPAPTTVPQQQERGWNRFGSSPAPRTEAPRQQPQRAPQPERAAPRERPSAPVFNRPAAREAAPRAEAPRSEAPRSASPRSEAPRGNSGEHGSGGTKNHGR